MADVTTKFEIQNERDPACSDRYGATLGQDASTAPADNAAPYRLPNLRAIKDRESFASLVVRNAEPYRFRDPTRVFHRIQRTGQPLQAIVCERRNPDVHAAVAALFGLDPRDLKRISYAAEDSTRFRFGAHTLPRDFLLLRRRRYCPSCLRQDAFHRMAWDFAVATACPEHRVALFDGCPRCGHPIDWQCASLTRCTRRGCRADLRDAVPTPLVHEHLRGVKAVLDALASGVPAGIGPHGASTADMVRLAFQLGAFGCGFERVGRPVDLLKRHPEAMHLVMNEGWRAL